MFIVRRKFEQAFVWHLPMAGEVDIGILLMAKRTYRYVCLYQTE